MGYVNVFLLLFLFRDALGFKTHLRFMCIDSFCPKSAIDHIRDFEVKSQLPHTYTKPEVLSPAGGWPQLRAAVCNGADAVYFGLQEGFNARARASNFPVDSLPEVSCASICST